MSCDYGKPEPLWDINKDAWYVWQDIQTQWRAGPMGVIGIDYAEVRQAFKDSGVAYTRRNKRKIMLIERVYLESVHTADK